jgi:hypothetical protein
MGHQQEHLTTLNGTPTRTINPRWESNTRSDNLKWDTKKETIKDACWNHMNSHQKIY